jgi:hypothetical protein
MNWWVGGGGRQETGEQASEKLTLVLHTAWFGNNTTRHPCIVIEKYMVRIPAVLIDWEY